MALTVTPTSGASPYTYKSVFDNKHRFASGLYRLEFRAVANVGSCSSDFSGAQNSPAIANAFMMTDSYTRTTDVAVGSCNNAQLSVVRISDGVIVSSLTASIDNV